jgi:hypothetical protein
MIDYYLPMGFPASIGEREFWPVLHEQTHAIAIAPRLGEDRLNCRELLHSGTTQAFRKNCLLDIQLFLIVCLLVMAATAAKEV